MAEDEVPRRMFRENEKPKGGKVNAYCDVRLIKDLEEALDESELMKLKDAGFRGLFEFHSKPSFSRAFILMLLENQLEVKTKKELWVLFAGKPIRVSLREFKIITGLRCGPYPDTERRRKKGTIGVVQPYYRTLFGLEKQVTVARVIEILKKRVVTDSDMRLRYAGLVIVDGILLTTSQGRPINEKHAEMARDLDKFLSYPWGRLSFEAMVDSIKSRDCWEIDNMSVMVQGFVHALQLVVVEAAPSIQIKRIQHRCLDEEDEEEDGEKGDEGEADKEAENETEKEGSSGVKYGVPFLILNAKEMDKKLKESPVDVETIIHPDYELTFPEEVLNWPCDVEDARIANMLRLAREGNLDPKMFEGGRVMSRLVKPAKKKSGKDGDHGQLAKGKAKVSQGSGSRGRKRQRESENDDCGDYENEDSHAVKAFISSSIAELGETLRAELKEDIRKIVKSSEESIVDAVKSWFRSTATVGATAFGHDDRASRGRNPGHTLSASVSTDEENGIRNETVLSSHSKETNQHKEARREESDVPGQDAPDNQTEPITTSPQGDSAGGLQSPRSPNSPVSPEFGQAFSPQPVSVEPTVYTRAETSPNASIPDGGASENQTLGEIRASLAKRKEDKVVEANLSVAPNDKGDEPAPTVDTVPAHIEKPESSRSKLRRTKRKRFQSKTLEEPYHCSTAMKVLVGHPKAPQGADGEFQAIEDHFNAQLARLKDLGGSLTLGEKTKITYREINEVVVKRKSITAKLMDALSAFVLIKYSLETDGETRYSTEFIDSKYVPALSKLSSNFAACNPKEHFLFPPAVAKYFVDEDGTGMYPSFLTVDRIYVPFCMAKKHWVVLCIAQQSRSVSVLGCTLRFITDEEIDKVLNCVATMLPYVLKQVDLTSCLTQQDVSAYAVKKHDNIPQILALEESGLVTLVLLRHHASNSLHSIQDSEFPSLYSKAKQIVAAFLEYCLPLPISDSSRKAGNAAK